MRFICQKVNEFASGKEFARRNSDYSPLKAVFSPIRGNDMQLLKNQQIVVQEPNFGKYLGLSNNGY
jgi:hypothetical protein